MEGSRIIIRSEFPVMPKAFGFTKSDEVVNQGILSVGRRQERYAGYNAVIVSGVETGAFVDVRLEGTSGDSYSPDVAEPFLVNALLCIEMDRVLLFRNAFNITKHDIIFPLPEKDS